MSSSHYYRTLWWASLPMLPVLALQGKYMRKRIPKLPEAEGPSEGRVHAGVEGSNPKSAAEVSIAILGESTAAGVGVASQSEGLAIGTARALSMHLERPVRWQAVGRTGATVRATKRELVERLCLPVDAVAVVLGANDTVRMTGEARWVEGARALAATLREAGAKAVVFSSVPPVGSFPALPQPLRGILGVRARLLDAILREALESTEGASYCDVTFPPGRDYMASDGFHPSGQGYQEWGRQLASKVSTLLTPP